MVSVTCIAINDCKDSFRVNGKPESEHHTNSLSIMYSPDVNILPFFMLKKFKMESNDASIHMHSYFEGLGLFADPLANKQLYIGRHVLQNFYSSAIIHNVRMLFLVLDNNFSNSCSIWANKRFSQCRYWAFIPTRRALNITNLPRTADRSNGRGRPYDANMSLMKLIPPTSINICMIFAPAVFPGRMQHRCSERPCSRWNVMKHLGDLARCT